MTFSYIEYSLSLSLSSRSARILLVKLSADLPSSLRKAKMHFQFTWQANELNWSGEEGKIAISFISSLVFTSSNIDLMHLMCV
jgi:hypothetical protein